MVEIESAQSGAWNQTATWVGGVVPGDGDSVIIHEGHLILVNTDLSTLASGLSINNSGVIHFRSFGGATKSGIKLNGNVSGEGSFIIAQLFDAYHEWVGYYSWTLVSGYDHVYRLEHDGSPYSQGVNITATIYETIGEEYLKVDSIEEVESNVKSFCMVDGITYIHPSSDDPNNLEHIYQVLEINRPDSGDEYRCHILLNDTAVINNPLIRGYGWTHKNERTTLASDANTGQNQVVLTEDRNLQPGDVVILGSGSVNNLITTAQKGVYTVSAYDPGTKTVTFTSNLDIGSFAGDEIALFSKPIKIQRTSGFGGVIRRGNIKLKGVCFADTKAIYPENGTVPYRLKDGLIEKCSCNYTLLTWGSGFVIKDCLVQGYSNSIGGTLCSSCSDCLIEDCIAINNITSFFASNVTVKNLITQNTTAGFSQKGSACSVSDSIFKNIAHITDGSDTAFTNCIFSGRDGVEAGSLYKNNFINCEFEESSDGVGWLGNYFGKLHNCLINDGDISINDFERPQNIVVESFDHNQIQDNYKAWMRGGIIETDFDGETCLPGRLIFNCESADYPVFRDFPVLLPSYRTQRWQALANKSFTGGDVKIELIDPTADPLIDPTAAPLASYSLPNESETNLPLKLGFKSDKAMMAILRISAKNASGTVAIDTRLIENRIQHGS